MRTMKTFPNFLNTASYIAHSEILFNSYKNLIGSELIDRKDVAIPKINHIWNAPCAIVSHGIEKDPIFNFGNKIALELFEFDFTEFIKLPSRKSAEEIDQEKRAKILAEVSKNGFIKNYTGVRISASGKRFSIVNTIIWNLSDSKGKYYGQAAMFEKWT